MGLFITSDIMAGSICPPIPPRPGIPGRPPIPGNPVPAPAPMPAPPNPAQGLLALAPAVPPVAGAATGAFPAVGAAVLNEGSTKMVVG